jgi:hypothetical protein
LLSTLAVNDSWPRDQDRPFALIYNPHARSFLSSAKEVAEIDRDRWPGCSGLRGRYLRIGTSKNNAIQTDSRIGRSSFKGKALYDPQLLLLGLEMRREGV